VLRSKGILVLFWQGKALGLVEGDDEDSGLGGLDNGGLGQRLGSGCENVSQLLYGAPVEGDAPMVFSVVGVVAPALGWPFSSLSVMVDVEGEREKALRGPRCVSLSSVAICQPSGGGLRGGQATPRSKQTLCELPRHDGQMDLVWSDQTTGVARGAKRSDE
jgi:hypothetical protein